MKYILLFFFLITVAHTSLAQAPQGIPYQAVARNSSGGILANQLIRVRFSIHDSVAGGTIVYREMFTPTTNTLGLFNVNVGMGTASIGTFSSINWGTNHKFMQVEMDPAGGTSYVDMGTTQMMSVPYALYANKSGVPGAVDLPVVATGPVSSISYTSANSSDTIKSNGGELILFRGICADTVLLPSINSCFFAMGNSEGSYSVNLSGLAPGKNYHVRAFATNKNGTAYGDTLSFNTTALSPPTVTTDTLSNITNVGASGGGNVTDDGGGPVTARGLCYSTSANPTIANSLSPAGSGTGSFSATLSGLTSSSMYHVRAYATNATGTSYGIERTFTTILLSVPTLTTDTISAISYTTATSGISVSNNGGSTITAQGICWNTSPNPTTTNTHVTTTTGVGHFSANLTGLNPNTVYYVRSYSTNTTGTAYGNQVTFTTLALSVPVLTTNAVIGVLTTTATSGGNITIGGGSPISAEGVCWSTTSVPTKDSSHTTDGTSLGIYNSNMTGLAPATTYYVRAYATNTTGTGYGAIISFTTDAVLSGLPTVPVVGTTAPGTAGSNVTSGGYVTISGGASVTAFGVCYGAGSSPTVSGAHTTDGTGLGYFTSILPLTGCATVYHVRAYATNSNGTGYGNEYTITSGGLPVLVDSAIRNITGTTAVSGGSVTSDGGCPVTQKGVCWGITANPTISNFHTNDGSGTGAYTSNLTGLYPVYTYHLRTYATNGSGTVYGIDQTFTTGASSTPVLGMTYAGGIVFYVDGTGNHGLVCAPTDQSTSALWGCNGTFIGATGTAIGTGQLNTAAIIANCTIPGIAAKICDDLILSGYNDWFLPSTDELHLMYMNLHLMGLGGLYSFYWSSSEVNGFSALIEVFSDGDVESYDKGTGFYVRAVRAF